MSTRRSPYESSLVASFFLTLGAYAARYGDSDLPALIAALGFQQTPLDEGIGDNMLQVADRYVLLEFKRRRADVGSELEKEQRRAFLGILRGNEEMSAVSDLSHFLAYGIGTAPEKREPSPLGIALAPYRVLSPGSDNVTAGGTAPVMDMAEFSLAGFARGLLRIEPARLAADLHAGFAAVLNPAKGDSTNDAPGFWNATLMAEIDRASATGEFGVTGDQFAQYLALLASALPDESTFNDLSGSDADPQVLADSISAQPEHSKRAKVEAALERIQAVVVAVAPGKAPVAGVLQLSGPTLKAFVNTLRTAIEKQRKLDSAVVKNDVTTVVQDQTIRSAPVRKPRTP